MISICYITSRPEPRFDWFFSSLRMQLQPDDQIEVIVVDFYAEACDGWTAEQAKLRGKGVMASMIESDFRGIPARWVPPKPNVWSGPHRRTKENWWAAANARNTALCYAKGEFWVCLDDRCVLQRGWMKAVRRAEHEQYVVCGPYQKRTGVTVENGFIKHSGIVTGEDNRLTYVREFWKDAKNPYRCPGAWLYGCSFGLPTEWALQVNGFAEDYCDSLSGEDYVFGGCLEASEFPIYFDMRMAIVEDRTGEFLGPTIKRTDKGTSPNDKSHKVLEVFKGSKVSRNSFDIRTLRNKVLTGAPFPAPIGPETDWYDGQLISSFI